MSPVRAAALAVIGMMLASVQVASAQPVRTEKPIDLPEWLELDIEYRVQSTYIDPLDLNGTDIQDVVWTEQRLRTELGLKYPGIGGIHTTLDFLGGVLFGDNGSIGSDPAPNSGLAIASKRPNNSSWEIGLRPGADPLDPASYIPILVSVAPIEIVHLYGEVLLPFGLVRIGRMPMAEGAGLSAHDGARRNRWGVSRYPDVADRVLFATKLDEIYNRFAHGSEHKPNPSIKEGIILAQTFDWNVQDQLFVREDDTYQTNTLISWRKERANWGGAEWRDFQLTATFVWKGSEQFDTQIFAVPLRFETHIGPVYINLQWSTIFGHSREVSEGLAVLSGKTPVRQDFLQLGGHAFVEYTVGPVQLALEFDYASGDEDPRSSTPLTSFSFSRDFNVGLLMFEHVMAFQTARSAAVGIENLAQLNASSFPLTEISSEGRFQNAIAVFPQITWNVLEGPQHWLHIRTGALVAWSAEPLVDPVLTSLREDGLEIADDAVNFHGGKPGRFYGTEIDLQIEWTWRSFFTWTVEGAVYFPGDAVQDENGDATTSFLVENRFLFTF